MDRLKILSFKVFKSNYKAYLIYKIEMIDWKLDSSNTIMSILSNPILAHAFIIAADAFDS